MSSAGVVYAALVLLGYDLWLQTTLRKRHQERRLLPILMLVLIPQGVVALMAVVRLLADPQAAAMYWQH